MGTRGDISRNRAGRGEINLAYVAGARRWFRFSRYELVRLGRWKWLYIRPAGGSTLELFRPLEGSEPLVDILTAAKDLFEIGDNLSRDERMSTEAKNGERMLRFCQQWGLLGLLWDAVEGLRVEEGGSESILVGWEQGWHGKTGWVDYEEAARTFFPSGELPGSCAVFQSADPGVLIQYAEPVFQIMERARSLLVAAQDWERFHGSGDSAFSSYTGKGNSSVRWIDALAKQLRSGPVWIEPVFESNRWKIDYAYRSLLAGLKLLLLFSATQQMSPVKQCASSDCGEWFIPGTSHAKYHRVSCLNREKQRARRRRQKDDALIGGSRGRGRRNL